MANWQHTLELSDLWRQHEEGKITASELGREVAKRLRQLSLPSDFQDEAEQIAEAFELEVDDVNDFDRILNDLYDLADTPLPTPLKFMQRRLMWVNTFS